jgi:hypothetical protein
MTEIAELQRTIGHLKQQVSALRARYGDVASVRRLANDVERLEIDTADFRAEPTAPSPRQPTAEHDVVVVPDTPYDRSMWRADDEYVRHDD